MPDPTTIDPTPTDAAPPATPDGAVPISGTPDPAPATPTEVAYQLTLPAESALDPAAVERTVALARARGLSNEAAQAVLDYAHSEAGSVKEALLQAHAPGGAAWTQQVETWKQQALSDPALGSTPEQRTAAIQKGSSVVRAFAQANPESGGKLVEFLDATGLGNHPSVVQFFRWLGESAGEAPFHASASGAPASEKSLTEIFYAKA